ncbi:hypothetical protein EVAR_12238_1 [Eumeta japonica]|uniref:Uncharacterized protein n=1 Tax=Eumeta variegata TaxID=151549 RepID=A0A4C1TU30_EUMVA|nr:hypothetical protein EVAR_12238_1 [Eumeta japonica]
MVRLYEARTDRDELLRNRTNTNLNIQMAIFLSIVATYDVRAKHKDSSEKNYGTSTEVSSYRSMHRTRHRLAGTFFARHFGTGMQPLAAESAGRLTKQNTGGDT